MNDTVERKMLPMETWNRGIDLFLFKILGHLNHSNRHRLHPEVCTTMLIVISKLAAVVTSSARSIQHPLFGKQKTNKKCILVMWIRLDWPNSMTKSFAIFSLHQILLGWSVLGGDGLDMSHGCRCFIWNPSCSPDRQTDRQTDRQDFHFSSRGTGYQNWTSSINPGRNTQETI
jgi:hypothetical protein